MEKAVRDIDQIWLDIAKRDPGNFRKVYSCHQASEILERTKKIMRRVFPKIPTPHGFYNPGDFFENLEIAAERTKLRRKIQDRISAKVQARDENLSLEDLVLRFNGNRTKN